MLLEYIFQIIYPPCVTSLNEEHSYPKRHESPIHTYIFCLCETSCWSNFPYIHLKIWRLRAVYTCSRSADRTWVFRWLSRKFPEKHICDATKCGNVQAVSVHFTTYNDSTASVVKNFERLEPWWPSSWCDRFALFCKEPVCLRRISIEWIQQDCMLYEKQRHNAKRTELETFHPPLHQEMLCVGAT